MAFENYELNEMQFDALKEIGNIGSGHAASALSSMLDRPIDINVPQIDILDYTEVVEKLVTDIADEIERMTDNAELHLLNENEIKVGNALVDLLRNWEEVLPNGGSNKLQKSSVLYFLREETMMTTKEVRDNMKKYKYLFPPIMLNQNF